MYMIFGLIAALIFIGTSAGAYVKGRADGREMEIAKQSETQQLIGRVKADAMDAAASAIANIEVKQITIKGRVEREVQTHTIYQSCEHTPDGLRNVNAALTNTDTASGPVGGGQLPASNPAR